MLIPSLIDQGDSVVICFATQQRLVISLGEAALLAAQLLDYLDHKTK